MSEMTSDSELQTLYTLSNELRSGIYTHCHPLHPLHTLYTHFQQSVLGWNSYLMTFWLPARKRSLAQSQRRRTKMLDATTSMMRCRIMQWKVISITSLSMQSSFVASSSSSSSLPTAEKCYVDPKQCQVLELDLGQTLLECSCVCVWVSAQHLHCFSFMICAVEILMMW